MMSLFKKVLVGYDGSSLSDKALQKACEFMDQDQSVQTHIVHVVHPSSQAMNGYGSLYLDINKKLEEHAEKLLSETRKQLAVYKNNCYFQILKGNIAKELTEYAQKYEIDLIIIGSRGHNAFNELILGSVSHHVLHYASCPVLLMN